jgi:Tfp pilus assembly protein PilO
LLKTRNWLITILVLALVVVYYLMVTDYLKQRRENNTLVSQVAETTQALAVIPLYPDDLAQQLSTAQASFDAARNEFPERPNTTGIINSILRLADDTEVKAIPIITQSWTVENISDYDYAAFRLKVTATGTYAKLVDFISRLETGEPKTLVIESLNAERTTETYGEEETAVFEAKLEVVVYARPPTADGKGKAE